MSWKKTAGIAVIAVCTLTGRTAKADSTGHHDYGIANPEHGVSIQIPKRDPKLEWFETAKFGLFVHWGFWTVDNVGLASIINPPAGKHTPESYFARLPRFCAENYDPEKWAQIFKDSGAKYTVFITKHHDGVAMWDTKAPGGIDVVDDGGAKRDLLAPFVAAMRKEGLVVGFYFSDADWHHPDYASLLPPEGSKFNSVSRPRSWSDKDDPERWARFIQYRDAQIGELMKYKPAIWWFDGFEQTAAEWQTDSLAERLIKNDPNVIFGRLGPMSPSTRNIPGLVVYDTPENVVPVKPPNGPWELCQTFNSSWSYMPPSQYDMNAAMVIRILSDTIARGGNYLLNIGPKADGTLPENEVQALLTTGAWLKRNAEAVYPAFGGEQFGLSFLRFQGPTTVAPDGKALYLFVNGHPSTIVVSGLVSKIRKAEVLSTGEELDSQRLHGRGGLLPGDCFIQVPKSLDPLMTVIKLSFDEVIELSP